MYLLFSEKALFLRWVSSRSSSFSFIFIFRNHSLGDSEPTKRFQGFPFVGFFFSFYKYVLLCWPTAFPFSVVSILPKTTKRYEQPAFYF